MEEKITNPAEEMPVAKHKRYLGDNIRRLRMMLGIKQSALAELIGYTPSGLSKVENKAEVDQETLAKIARALRVPIELIENFETEEIVKKIQYLYDNAQQFEDSTINQNTTNELDVIKFALEANQKLYERVLRDKETRINELKADNKELLNRLNNKK